MITLYSIFITVAAYFFTLCLSKKFPMPLTNPVFLSTGIIMIILWASNITYDEYVPAKEIMTYLLGPATVALAIPIYKNGGLIVKYLWPAVIGLFIGVFTTVMSAILLAKWFHFPKVILLSLSVKSVTIPVAAEIAKIMNGNISLTAVIVIITGMIGAMFGGKVLTFFNIYHPFARGLSIGTIAHGIGTAEAVREGEVQGAVAGAAMGIAAVLTSLIIPYFNQFLI